MSTIFPPYLKKGDTIGLTLPAGYMAAEKVETSITVLQSWGLEVMVGKTIGSDSTTYFSGTDEERLCELQAMLDDDNIKAILCARGGYGTVRIIDKLNFKKFKKNPKWIIGFSDITILHNHLQANFNIASLHAPMSAAFNDDGYKNEYVQSLKKALFGKQGRYSAPGHENNIAGKAEGKLVGGNLSLFVNTMGTSSEVKTKGRILFLEDIGEYIYSIDRMMHQLKRSAKLKNLAGLILGGFTDMKDTDRPFGIDTDTMLKEFTEGLNCPVAFHFPVSHNAENYALKVGAKYTLNVSKKKVTLTEI